MITGNNYHSLWLVSKKRTRIGPPITPSNRLFRSKASMKKSLVKFRLGKHREKILIVTASHSTQKTSQCHYNDPPTSILRNT